MTRRWLLFFCNLLLAITGAAQKPSLYFNNLSAVNGLSNNKVNCILQDRRGFMWIGTDDGLNRYDGYRFQTFRHEKSKNGLSGNIITDLHEDEEGVIWISTADGGLTRYNYHLPASEQFKSFRHAPADAQAISANILNAIEEDANGFLWLASSGQGLLRFDKKKREFSEPVKRPSRTVLALCKDNKGKIWAGREGGGLIRVDPVSFECEEDSRYKDVYAKLPHQTVTSLFRDRSGNIWMGSWDKVVYRIENSGKDLSVFSSSSKPYSFIPDDPLCFAEDNRGYIWIGGQYAGLHLFNTHTGQFFNYRHQTALEGSIADDRINCIYIDRSGIVWIGTNMGISMHDPSTRQFEQTFLPAASSSLVIYDYLNLEDDCLLMGTSEGLFRQYRDGSFSQEKLMYKGRPLSATRFYQDEELGLMIGTNVSLFRYLNGKLQLLPNTENDVVMGNIIESRVTSILRDSMEGHPALLVIPFGHYIAYYDLFRKTWINRRDTSRNIIARLNIRDNLVRKFFKAANGQIWIATVKAGLGEWKQSGITYYSHDPANNTSIGSNHIFDLAEDKNHHLWITTYGAGLFQFNPTQKTFERVPASHNLAEGIQIDASGNIWMIANGSLHKYNPQRKSYTSFQLPDVEKTGGVKGPIYKDPRGRMYLSGNRYFISFHPDSIPDVRNKLAVCLTDLRVFDSSYSDRLYLNKPVRLPYNQNYFTIEFAAPMYQAGYPVQYSHMLEGADRDWIMDGQNNSANYTNLDAGDYVFKVRASIKPGEWSDQPTILYLRIYPPFWKTGWFFSICLAGIAILIYGIYKYRINELLKRQAIRNKIAQDLHDNIGSTLSSISVYSQVAKIYRQKDKQEALQETLEKISSTSSEMISEMNDIVWAINPRNDSMSTILQRMESFARPLLASRNIQFRFEADDSILALQLEMTKRKNFYLIFKEAVNNALKYADSKNLWVTIRLEGNMLLLDVKDDGKGMDKTLADKVHSLSGNGLPNMKRRAKEMNGKLVVESETGRGTSIRLQFPIP